MIGQRTVRKCWNGGEGNPVRGQTWVGLSVFMLVTAGVHGTRMEALHGFHDEEDTEVTATAHCVTLQKGSLTKA